MPFSLNPSNLPPSHLAIGPRRTYSSSFQLQRATPLSPEPDPSATSLACLSPPRARARLTRPPFVSEPKTFPSPPLRDERLSFALPPSPGPPGHLSPLTLLRTTRQHVGRAGLDLQWSVLSALRSDVGRRAAAADLLAWLAIVTVPRPRPPPSGLVETLRPPSVLHLRPFAQCDTDNEALSAYWSTRWMPWTANPGVTVASILVSVLGSYATLLILGRRTSNRGFGNGLLLVLGAGAFTVVAVWSMHFVGPFCLAVTSSSGRSQGGSDREEQGEAALRASPSLLRASSSKPGRLTPIPSAPAGVDARPPPPALARPVVVHPILGRLYRPLALCPARRLLHRLHLLRRSGRV